MPDLAISVENLSKRYRIGRREKQHDTLMGALVASLTSPFSNLRQLRRLTRFTDDGDDGEILWALKDVSFDVKQGEVLGIIGRNGAGKSTLLKILSRITQPTSGRAVIHGRVASLLEVGTGFHPELTGRENIYLNGTILGMTKREVDSKLDQIIAFAEIERFIDTPVKRYSSGMYVRLAFAVAAHLEPEILLVDEVLAVGDTAFQNKCLKKMDDVARTGRTVLFVSHNLTAVRNLCSQALMLANGRVYERDETQRVVEHYLSDTVLDSTLADVPLLITRLPRDDTFRLMAVSVSQNGKTVHGSITSDRPVEIAVTYEVLQRVSGLRVYLDLCDEEGNLLVQSFHDEEADERPTTEPGAYISTALIPPNYLAPRRYNALLQATIHNVRYCIPGGITLPLDVVQSGRLNRAYMDEPVRGKLSSAFLWATRPADSGRTVLDLGTDETSAYQGAL